MTTKSPRPRIFERIENPMLILAGLAICLYLGNLIGIWAKMNLESVYFWAALSIDIVFVLDLVIKISIQRGEYLRSPWFLIDLISTLPIVDALITLPASSQGFRFVRGFRLFRVMRTLRTLRMLRALNLLTTTESQQFFKPSKVFNRTIQATVLVYTLLFTGLIFAIYSKVGPDSPQLLMDAQITEFYLVLGSLMGMLLTAIIMRFFILEITNHQFQSLLDLALPSQVSNHFLRKPNEYHQTVSMPATVIFCDLKGFTQTVEQLGGDLHTLKTHLEDAMAAVTEAHKKHDLIIDKYIGDAVMSFRGGNLVTGTAEDHAMRVVMATLDGIRALQKLKNPFFNEMKIGGASSKSALIGAFGSRNRLSYTILGDRVNLAARLESSVSHCQTSNLFCDLTQKLTSSCDHFLWRRFGQLRVAGKDEAVIVHEVFYAKDYSDTTWIEYFHQALEYFERKEIAQALDKFQQANSFRSGGDQASQQYIKNCEILLRNGFNQNWTPVFEPQK